jgi:epoxyqueuosine reductase
VVRARARELGFDVVGVARADVPLDVEHARYLAFLEEGRHGEMGWLADNADARRRLDGREILPGARSVVCVGLRYRDTPAAEAAAPPLAHTVARYARGQDYHNFMRKRLRRLAKLLRTLEPGARARPLCDVEPVLERAWAARAGLGFVGKNGLVITPGQGSFQLIGEVVTTVALTPDTPMEERCGSCTRCLDACPTDAFAAPFQLDPRRCLSYLSIELHAAPPESLRDGFEERLFGCDVCQDVCPFNARAPATPAPPPFRPLPRWGAAGLAALVTLDAPGFAHVAEGTPLKRSGRAGLARNAVLVAAGRLAGGAREPAELDDARATLAAGLAHDDGSVREVAAWAARRSGCLPPEAPAAGAESAAAVEPLAEPPRRGERRS